MAERIFQVDAFTAEAFSGNPAAVCILDAERPDAWMQSFAAEMNLSDTAFVLPQGEEYSLRWFTPAAEVSLCGHATLATAHVLWEQGLLAPDATARFNTKSGPLSAAKNGDWIEMDFPAEPDKPAVLPDALARALGAEPEYFGRNRMDCIVLLESEAVVRGLRPDFAALAKIPSRGFIVTSEADGAGTDFVSRFFAPGIGIDEDPVTGSAHCCLGPFWSRRLGKSEFAAHQVSARGGALRVKVCGERVIIAGQAVTIFSGTLAN